MDILAALRALPDGRSLSPRELERIIRAHNRGLPADECVTKRELLPWYRNVRSDEPDRWESWGIEAPLERRLVASLRMKPGRSAAGVAAVTCLTPPWPCSGRCVFCPQDLRMPKSYLASEPACRRAEQNYFDPYLQVASRLTALHEMGHDVSRVELSVLGGTWTDYPLAYRRWFVCELYRAVTDWPDVHGEVARRRAWYEARGWTTDEDELARRVAAEQARVDAGKEGYDEGLVRLSPPSLDFVRSRSASLAEVVCARCGKDDAACRVVGLSVETRPDAVTPQVLRELVKLGCTRLQLGVQSTRQELLDANARGTTLAQVERAFALARLHGLAVHAHLMANLVGATPEGDVEDYRGLMADPALVPDEVKLYPCALVAGTGLERAWRKGRWRPYTRDELLSVLSADVLATPPYVRISRMVRDIPAHDILAGNRRGNLRQAVEARLADGGRAGEVRELRFRERAVASTGGHDVAGAASVAPGRVEVVPYATATSEERFVQLVGEDERPVAYLRLSLPHWDRIAAGQTCVRPAELPVRPGDALVRELRVRGDERGDEPTGAAASWEGTARRLVRNAADRARYDGYLRVVVLRTSVTASFWRTFGFKDEGDYLVCVL